MRGLRWIAVVQVLAGAYACGGDDRGGDAAADAATDAQSSDSRPDERTEAGGEVPSCDLWRDPSNCWPKAAASLYECIPDEVGTLSEDRAACTFSDGTRVDFARPLPNFLGNHRPDFTIRTAGGDVCGAFFERDEETQNGVESIRQLTAGGTVARFVQVPPVRGTPAFPESTLTLYCDDAVFLSGAFPDVLDCAFMGVSLPGWNADFDEQQVTIGVSADGVSGPLFVCTSP